MFLKFRYVGINIRILSLFMAERYSLVGIYLLFIWSSDAGPLGWRGLVSIVIGVHGSTGFNSQPISVQPTSLEDLKLQS